MCSFLVPRRCAFAGPRSRRFFGSRPTDVFSSDLALAEAVERVEGWLAQPCVRIVNPTERHWVFFRELLLVGTATANLVADAHLAALAMEHGCELNSTDRDFARFPKLAWRNPLQESMPPRGPR